MALLAGVLAELVPTGERWNVLALAERDSSCLNNEIELEEY